MSGARFHSVAEARTLARRGVPRALFDYIDGAAEDERTAARNLAAFGDVTFVPRAGGAVREPRLETSILGTPVSMPVVLAPCGLIEIMHRDGTAGVVRAAGRRQVLCTISTVAGMTAAQAAAASDRPLWFQLYSGNRERTEELVTGAAEAGYEALVVTMDTPVLGNRERDARNGVTLPPRLLPGSVLRLGAQVVSRPRWAAGMAVEAARRYRERRPAEREVGRFAMSGSPFSWDDVAEIRRLWQGQLLVKGLVTADDAKLAIDAGADALVVSNHGGRQLEDAPATLPAVPAVVAAGGGQVPVLVDGGVRRGSDVVKAVALGAAGVLVGRAYLYGFAAAGQAGVERVLGILRADIARTLSLLGCAGVEELDPSWVTIPAAWPR